MTTSPMAKAAWKVMLGDLDLTDKIRPRLISLTLDEDRADKADQLTIVVNDADGKMVVPSKGATLTLAMGWIQGANLPMGLVDKGKFKVDEVCLSGPPDVITIRARSADFTDAFKTRRERSFVGQSLGAILGAIAADNGLTAKVDQGLAAKIVPALGHTARSDAALLALLGRRYDAVATVKAGILVFANIGKAKTASGATIPAETIDRSQCGPFDYKSEDRGKYNGCSAVWHDKAGATRHTVTVGDGGSGHPKRLRRIYHTETDARAAAEAENGRTERGKITISFALALGRADLYPDRPITLTGFKDVITAQSWLLTKVTHAMDGRGGLTSRLTLETGKA